MDTLFPFLGPLTLIIVLGIAFLAGFVKGVVGFALPLVLISGLTLFLPAEIALAGVIVPLLVTNAIQSLRKGPGAAWNSAKNFRTFLISGGIAMVLAAQLVRVVADTALLAIIGVTAVIYALLQLAGVRLTLKRRSNGAEATIGTMAGFFGGLSGVWGPPTVMYLTAIGTPKEDSLRIQGVIYGAGSVVLCIAHAASGVVRAETLPFSILLILPAVAGMWVGGRVVDRIDQERFKAATLIVLLIAGANLIRRAVS
ncbi:sulfite exporter TauE/SafE family protein [Sulfitobacter sp. F26204]|uniref:sulfite exporter TauE/SafE family protein n=1 Tax=Sulfitobacter sp. F26204 TaxID=2996014 RepID=UPI00225E6955|nr:sulfite exporter TauE/SafE family protein [Sulfitobacter sp. F26204]MCX7558660.1 sulfite exporter TauE/SafE family protein [Sulfitobacter sp. F26204]